MFGFLSRRLYDGERMTFDDRQLLEDFARNGSEAAFRELVARHVKGETLLRLHYHG